LYFSLKEGHAAFAELGEDFVMRNSLADHGITSIAINGIGI